MERWKNWWANCGATLLKLTRATALFLIAVYRASLSGWLGTVCRFQPTCSAYAHDAFLTHTPWRALVLTLQRLAKCHPFGPFGFDPVPNARLQSVDEGFKLEKR